MSDALSTKKLVLEIIYAQSAVIGVELARRRATATGTISFGSASLEDISIKKEDSSVFVSLISSYEELFGPASVEVCLDVFRKYNKEMLAGVLPKDYFALL